MALARIPVSSMHPVVVSMMNPLTLAPFVLGFVKYFVKSVRVLAFTHSLALLIDIMIQRSIAENRILRIRSNIRRLY